MVQNQLNPALYQSQLQYHHPTIEELAAAQQQAMQMQVVAAAAQQHTQSSALITPVSHITTAQAPAPPPVPVSTCSEVIATAVSTDSPLQLLPKDSKPVTTASTTTTNSLTVGIYRNSGYPRWFIVHYLHI